MVAFTTFFSLALLAPLLASGLVLKRSGCNISNMQIPNLPQALTAPTAKGSFVGIAIGTQNYTCTSTGTYTNVGALAELFDISCLINTPLFGILPDIAIAAWEAAPPAVSAPEMISTLHLFSGPVILGQHYYVTNPITGSGINPKWDFTSQGADAGNPNAFVVASKINSTTALTGSKDIDWVFLKSLTGSLAQEVYRTDTRLGQPPATVLHAWPGSPEIVVKYAAKYWGFGGSV
ncbi:putative malate dehydrogenase [Flammula alnicola]|nr:putative malate dehydrogenase [Flammula alnicola]